MADADVQRSEIVQEFIDLRTCFNSYVAAEILGIDLTGPFLEELPFDVQLKIVDDHPNDHTRGHIVRQLLARSNSRSEWYQLLRRIGCLNWLNEDDESPRQAKLAAEQIYNALGIAEPLRVVWEMLRRGELERVTDDDLQALIEETTELEGVATILQPLVQNIRQAEFVLSLVAGRAEDPVGDLLTLYSIKPWRWHMGVFLATAARQCKTRADLRRVMPYAVGDENICGAIILPLYKSLS